MTTELYFLLLFLFEVAASSSTPVHTPPGPKAR